MVTLPFVFNEHCIPDDFHLSAFAALSQIFYSFSRNKDQITNISCYIQSLIICHIVDKVPSKAVILNNSTAYISQKDVSF